MFSLLFLYYIFSETIISCSSLLDFKIIIIKLSQNNLVSNCQEYVRQSDWNFLNKFYYCKKAIYLQIEELQVQITRLNRALQYTDINAQNNRIVFNKFYIYFQELQNGYNISKTARVKYKNQLHKKRLEYCLIEKFFSQKQYYVEKVEKNLK